MKKEIERLEQKYKNSIKGSINLQMEKSDAYDSRSPRCYRIFVRTINDKIICEYGFCKDKEKILERFENKLKEMNK